MTGEPITLADIQPDDVAAFKKELQDAFALAVVDEFGNLPDGPIPSDEDLDRAVKAPGAVVLRILCDGRNVGGAVVTINAETRHNSLDLFFLKVGEQGRGLGLKAWHAIEQRFPETVTWQTHTPYFEKRNIHFYVNKCGFKIIEFFNKHHPDPNQPEGEDDLPGEGEAFQFEKVMKTV
ncbi:MAG TPA: GNAT family N-acetyltransferase [Rhizobiaceae bacterium]